jgi:hypothetical protein
MEAAGSCTAALELAAGMAETVSALTGREAMTGAGW